MRKWALEKRRRDVLFSVHLYTHRSSSMAKRLIARVYDVYHLWTSFNSTPCIRVIFATEINRSNWGREGISVEKAQKISFQGEWKKKGDELNTSPNGVNFDRRCYFPTYLIFNRIKSIRCFFSLVNWNKFLYCPCPFLRQNLAKTEFEIR